jgi:hypothetical protein
LSKIESRLDVLLKHPDIFKLEQFEASRQEEGPDGKFSSSERMMLWTVGHPDGMTRRPDGWQGTKFFDL